MRSFPIIQILTQRHLDDEVVSLFLEPGLLHQHHDTQQLIRQTLLDDDEVDDSRFSAHLRRVVRVRQFGRDVEAEVGVVVQRVLTDLDTQTSSLVDDVFR
jgi:hypothetical protein